MAREARRRGVGAAAIPAGFPTTHCGNTSQSWRFAPCQLPSRGALGAVRAAYLGGNRRAADGQWPPLRVRCNFSVRPVGVDVPIDPRRASGAKPPLEGRWRAKRDGEVLGQLRFPQASPQRTAVTPLSHGALRHASSPQGEPWVRCGRRTWVGIGGLRTANGRPYGCGVIFRCAL